MGKKLSKTEEAVLLFLYENKDAGTSLDTDAIIAATGLSKREIVQAIASLVEGGLIGGPPSLLNRAMAALKEMDEKFTPVSEGYAEHIILIASLLASANEADLAAELGYDAEMVNLVGSRLRGSGVWAGDEVSPQHLHAWTSDGGGTAFFLDGAVARGDLQIVGHTPEAQYQMTTGAKRRVELLLRRTGGKDSPHGG